MGLFILQFVLHFTIETRRRRTVRRRYVDACRRERSAALFCDDANQYKWEQHELDTQRRIRLQVSFA